MIDDLYNMNETPSRGDIAEKLNESTQTSPEEVTIQVVLSGVGAARYNFVKSLLMISLGMSERDADAYICRVGAEAEISKLAELWNKKENSNEGR